MLKIKLQKIIANLLDKRRKSAWMEWSSRNFYDPQVIENSRHYLLLQTDIVQNWVPLCIWPLESAKFHLLGFRTIMKNFCLFIKQLLLSLLFYRDSCHYKSCGFTSNLAWELWRFSHPLQWQLIRYSIITL